MKKKILQITLLTALALALFSCSSDKSSKDKKENTEQSEKLNSDGSEAANALEIQELGEQEQPLTAEMLIPKDAMMVFSMNIGQIAEKADLFSDENIKFLTDLLKQSGDKSLIDKVTPLLKNPKSSGLDINKPAYMFVELAQAKADYKHYMGMCFTLTDKEDFLNLIFNNGDRAGIPTREFAGFEVIETDISAKENFLLATKGEVAFFFVGEGNIQKLKGYAEAILEQKAEDSFATTKAYAKMIKKQEDFELSIELTRLAKAEAVLKELNNTYRISEEEAKNVLKNMSKYQDLYYIFGLNSEASALKLYFETYSSDNKYQTDINLAKEIMPLMKGELLKLIPENSLLSFAISLNGEKAWKNTKAQNPESIKVYEKKAERAIKALGCSFEELMRLFNGDAVFNMSLDPMRAMMGEVDARLLVETTDTELAAKILSNAAANAPIEKIRKLNKNQYVLSEKMDIHFGLKGNIIYFGTLAKNSDVNKLFEEAKPNITESRFAKEYNNKRFSFSFDMDKAITMIKPFVGQNIPAPVMSSLEKLDYLGISSGEEITKGVATLQLKDSEPYSLLLGLAKEMSK